MALLQALILALLALILTPGYLFYFDITPKIVVLFAGTAVVVAATAFTGTRIPPKSRTLQIFSALLLLNILSLAVSSILSARPDLSPFGTNWRRFGSVVEVSVFLFAWLIAVTCAGRLGRVRTILRGVTAAGALSAAYGIAQYLGFDPILDAATYHTGEGIGAIVRPPGTFGYASYFATWLLFVVFLSLALAEMEKSRLLVRCCRGTALLAICAILLTGTRAAVVGLAAGGLVWLLLRKRSVPRRALAVAGFALLAVVVFYFSPPGQLLRGRMHWFTEDPWGGARLLLWRDSLQMAVHRPLAGFGPEAFMSVFPRYESARLARAYPDFAYESPHNMFLDALLAQGVPGFLLLAALGGLGFLAAFRLRQAAIAGALAAGVVSQQFTAFTVPTAFLFFVTIGLLVALDTPSAGAFRRRRLVLLPAGAAALTLLYLAIRLGAADHALAATQDSLEQRDMQSAAAAFQEYEDLRLPGGTAEIWYSRAALALAQSTPPAREPALIAANAAAFRSTQTAEDPFNAWYNFAVLCGSQEKADCVEKSLLQAIRTSPNWYKPHWTFARVLILDGRLDEASREASLAADLDGGQHPEVTTTLTAIRARLASLKTGVLQK